MLKKFLKSHMIGVRTGQEHVKMVKDASGGYTNRLFTRLEMPHSSPNKYPNIFGCHIFTKQISEYIHTQDMTQI